MNYAALLRGINVGGHHKVPMADLRKCIADQGFDEVKTLLNSGNVVFNSLKERDTDELRLQFGSFLEEQFGFPIPVFIISAAELFSLREQDPFANIEITPDTRNYITFFRTLKNPLPDLPWKSDDGAFRILNVSDRFLISSLDISIMKTPDAMKVVDFHFGKDNTTRNWNTMERIMNLMR